MGVEKLIIKSTIKLIYENREALTPELLGAVSKYKECVTLAMSDLPTIEIKLSATENKLDFLINFLREFYKF